MFDEFRFEIRNSLNFLGAEFFCTLDVQKKMIYNFASSKPFVFTSFYRKPVSVDLRVFRIIAI